MITLGHLKTLLHYDQDSGLWTWNISPVGWINPGQIAGSISDAGYVIIRVAGRNYKAHRLAWFYMTGNWPVGKIDHENTCRADNRWENLRPATDRQNAQNRRIRRDNAARLKGVSFHRGTGRYQAQIQVDGKKLCLGYCDDPVDAHALYCAAAELHFGQFARRN